VARATSHLFGWPLASQQAPVGAWPFFYAGILELIASILITAGLFTRTAAFVASGVMAFAFFTQHLPTGVIPMTNGGELAVLYCFAFFFLVFAGGGTFALDARLHGAFTTRRAYCRVAAAQCWRCWADAQSNSSPPSTFIDCPLT
jgi:putative oxidoreductase